MPETKLTPEEQNASPDAADMSPDAEMEPARPTVKQDPNVEQHEVHVEVTVEGVGKASTTGLLTIHEGGHRLDWDEGFGAFLLDSDPVLRRALVHLKNRGDMAQQVDNAKTVLASAEKL